MQWSEINSVTRGIIGETWRTCFWVMALLSPPASTQNRGFPWEQHTFYDIRENNLGDVFTKCIVITSNKDFLGYFINKVLLYIFSHIVYSNIDNHIQLEYKLKEKPELSDSIKLLECILLALFRCTCPIKRFPAHGCLGNPLMYLVICQQLYPLLPLVVASVSRLRGKNQLKSGLILRSSCLNEWEECRDINFNGHWDMKIYSVSQEERV